MSDTREAMIAEHPETDALEWGRSFLAEAAKDKADAEQVLADPAAYDRTVRQDARSRLVRLNDPDGVVPMVTALVGEIERLKIQWKGAEDYGKEAWDWLQDALDALGVKTVFDIAKAKADRGR